MAASSSTASAEDVVARLQRRLEEHADERRRAWWTAYLKGTASFRGVAMGDVRREVRRLWNEELSTWPVDDVKRLAVVLLHEERSEDKLAGVLLLAEHLLDHLGADDLPMLAGPYADGAVADWNVCDWYAVKVLAPLCARDGAEVAEPLAAWSTGDGPLWLRRAPAAAFAVLAARPDPLAGFDRLCAQVSQALSRDPERFAQTAVAWLSRELAKRARGADMSDRGRPPDRRGSRRNPAGRPPAMSSPSPHGHPPTGPHEVRRDETGPPETAPDGAPADGFAEQPGQDPGDASRRPSPYSVLNTPVGEPDPTEWPDPYDRREDPLAPPEEMVFPGDGVHTPVGATSTSQPHPAHDIEAIGTNAVEGDRLDA